MKRTLTAFIFFSGLIFGQGSVTLNAGQPATAAVPGTGTAVAGTGATATTCTIAADAVPAANITTTCPLGTGGSSATIKIAVTAGMNWPISVGVNGNIVSITVAQATAGGPITVTASSTVAGTVIATKTANF